MPIIIPVLEVEKILKSWLRTTKDVYGFYGLVTPHQDVKM
jgi:hypothetical protein